VTEDTNQGSSTCPWIITVQHGQRINLTLVDFAVTGGTAGSGGRGGGGGGSHVCTMYAVVREMYDDVGSDITVCGGEERKERAVYFSEKNSLVVQVKKSNLLSSEIPFFLLKYDGMTYSDLFNMLQIFFRLHFTDRCL